MTLPSEIINKAIVILQVGGAASLQELDAQVKAQPPKPGQANGWCQGAGDVDGARSRVSVKDKDGRSVRLFKGGADKAILNRDAVRFSATASIAKVLADRSVQPEQLKLMWDTVWQIARAEPSVRHLGGVGNYTHPLVAFNEVPGRLGGDVVNLFKAIAAQLAATEGPPAALARGRGVDEEPDDVDMAHRPPRKED